MSSGYSSGPNDGVSNTTILVVVGAIALVVGLYIFWPSSTEAKKPDQTVSQQSDKPRGWSEQSETDGFQKVFPFILFGVLFFCVWVAEKWDVNNGGLSGFIANRLHTVAIIPLFVILLIPLCFVAIECRMLR